MIEYAPVNQMHNRAKRSKIIIKLLLTFRVQYFDLLQVKMTLVNA